MNSAVEMIDGIPDGFVEDCKCTLARLYRAPELPIMFIPDVFRKQIGKKNCGIRSSMIVDLAIKKSQNHICSPEQYTLEEEESFVESLESISMKYVNKNGMSLHQVAELLTSKDLHVSVHQTFDDFNSIVPDVFTNGGAVIVNFDLKKLGYQWGGHHSPLGGYNREDNTYLLWDTWSYTPTCWIEERRLIEAMDTEDDGTKTKRGYIIVHR